MDGKESKDKEGDRNGKKEEDSNGEDKKGKDFVLDAGKEDPSLAETTEKSDDYKDDDSIRNIFSDLVDDPGGFSRFLLDEPEEETIKVFGEEYKIKINGGNGNGFGSHGRKEENGSKGGEQVSEQKDMQEKENGDKLFEETDKVKNLKEEEKTDNITTKTGSTLIEEKTSVSAVPSKSANGGVSDRSRSREKKIGVTGRSKSMGRNAVVAGKNKSRERGITGRSKSRERNIRPSTRSKSREKSIEDEKEEIVAPDPGNEPEDIIVTFGKGKSQGYFIAHAVDDARGFVKGGKGDQKEPGKGAAKPTDKLRVKDAPRRRAKSDERTSLRVRTLNKTVKKPAVGKPGETKVEKKQVAAEGAPHVPGKGDGTNGGGATAAKPGSAGATREAAMRVLQLCQKGEWPPMDQVLKGLEKTVAAGGDDVNPTPLAGIMDPITGMTPLMFAVKENRTSFVDRMIDLGCDITARNNDNYNALHIASMFSREDVVKVLLNKKGVDVYAPGGAKQQTAVHLVASRQTGTATSILRVLLAAAGKEIRMRADAPIPPERDIYMYKHSAMSSTLYTNVACDHFLKPSPRIKDLDS